VEALERNDLLRTHFMNIIGSLVTDPVLEGRAVHCRNSVRDVLVFDHFLSGTSIAFFPWRTRFIGGHADFEVYSQSLVSSQGEADMVVEFVCKSSRARDRTVSQGLEVWRLSQLGLGY
jgi:hypothetical protein